MKNFIVNINKIESFIIRNYIMIILCKVYVLYNNFYIFFLSIFYLLKKNLFKYFNIMVLIYCFFQYIILFVDEFCLVYFQ